MVKSAGFLKRLKNFGEKVGKGLKWVNTNLIKPNKEKIDELLDFVPYGNYIKKGVDFGSKIVDKIPLGGKKSLKGGPSKYIDLFDSEDDF